MLYELISLITQLILFIKSIQTILLKGNMQFIFSCNPQKSMGNAFLMEILKSIVTKKVIVCFDNLGEENF